MSVTDRIIPNCRPVRDTAKRPRWLHTNNEKNTGLTTFTSLFWQVVALCHCEQHVKYSLGEILREAFTEVWEILHFLTY